MANSQPFELLIFVVLFILMALCLVSSTIIHASRPMEDSRTAKDEGNFADK